MVAEALAKPLRRQMLSGRQRVRMESTMSDLELKDIQGLVVRGYGSLEAACYIPLQIQDGEAARHWLVTLADQITNADTRPTHTALNVAFTHAGLVDLGLDAETRDTLVRPERHAAMRSPRLWANSTEASSNATALRTTHK